MDRKKTILIAVMINAGLLAILFIASLATSEDLVSPSVELSQPSLGSALEKPLFPDTADLAMQGPSLRAAVEIPLSGPEKPVQVALPPSLGVSAPLSEEALVHKLPPLVPEALHSAPLPVAPVAKTEPGVLEVTVKKGDSLDKIAKAHHTTVDEIIKINHLPSSFLRVGQVLKLPAEKGAVLAIKPKPVQEKTSSPGSAEYYTVKVGDNPWTIAMKHHLKVEELLKLNQLNEEKARKLKPGDRLRIR